MTAFVKAIGELLGKISNFGWACITLLILFFFGRFGEWGQTPAVIKTIVDGCSGMF